MRTTTPLLHRIARHLLWQPDGCWTWQGNRTVNGYGRIGSGRSRENGGRTVLVHRAMYELLVGPIPKGLDLDHLCRVRHCANVLHLEPVDRRTNLLRGIGPDLSRARRGTHCGQGHEFNDVNTYVNQGRRYCRACHRERARVRRLQGVS